ncbi:MAG: hypothetical protein JNK87_15880 [Bryobacterales bacterium]|nr:hypothetical protein [Bryobacterales bacterium]
MSNAAWWLLPVAVLLAVHGWGLAAWFQQDDFAWLGLVRDWSEGGSLGELLFRPSQHGTWRPLSERAYFLFFPAVFGWESWPMRVWAFLTQAASLVLLQAIGLRLGLPRAVAVMAAVLWAANAKISTAMISNGAYVHVMGGFFLLLALWCSMTERWRAMWAAFLTGFFVMESNVVFPALACAYWVWRGDRDKLRRVLWLWPVSLVYYALHMQFAPKLAEGSYAMHFDWGMLRTFGRYLQWAFQADNLRALTGLPEVVNQICGVLFPVVVLALVGWRAWRRDLTPLLAMSWFGALLGPVLPLREHVTDYYLTVPLAGLCLLTAMVLRWRWGWALLALYLLTQAPAAYKTTQWWQQRSLVAKDLVRQVWTVHKANPGRLILLDGVTDEQFWAALAHYPFVERGKTYVFLTPETRARIVPHPESGVRLEEFFLEEVPRDAVRFTVKGAP